MILPVALTYALPSWICNDGCLHALVPGGAPLKKNLSPQGPPVQAATCVNELDAMQGVVGGGPGASRQREPVSMAASGSKHIILWVCGGGRVACCSHLRAILSWLVHTCNHNGQWGSDA